MVAIPSQNFENFMELVLKKYFFYFNKLYLWEIPKGLMSVPPVLGLEVLALTVAKRYTSTRNFIL